MRSALLCVFFTLIIHKEGSTVRGDDFRPTPIPLDEWHPTKRDESAGTLHEIIKTESPPSVAAVPAHYWEDALRHSVYLTLVRDKIDQLIAQGDVISPNSKLNQPISKEIDDHDLWDKIKKAPFDRRQSEEANPSGDVAIMAKGRLLENEEGFRFTEDDKLQDNCSDDRCAEGVKAFWSVKRVRQRDQETSPGKYHYELTFSVVSQIPKKQPKPYQNPIRTFTVREMSPERTVDFPQEHRNYETFQFQTARPQRAIWFHKNIVPIPPQTRRQPYRGLDRIFSSIFSYDDDSSFDQPQPKYRSNSASSQAYQYSKIGQAGPSVDHHQQPKPIPYPYKQSQPYKYVRPPLKAPPAGPLQHHYLDYESSPIINGNPYPPHDSRIAPTQAMKTTRPAILPTPVPLAPPLNEQTFDLGTPMFIDSAENSENITRYEINNSFKNPTRIKPNSPKVNYFPEQIRPPVYNAPPGVFVTMDKKPFKPMPPLKHSHNSKPHRVNKPADFRPSPQVHDPQSPNSDPLFETAFRPITVNYADSSTTETVELVQVKKSNNKQRKTSTNAKKPSKKHHNVKTTKPLTTATPDIITAQSIQDEDGETLDWANVLGAFTKTTPMVLQTEKLIPVETTTSFSLNSSTTIISKKPTPVTEDPAETTTTSTTIRPSKRTRPPPKFTKQDKFKKHKRVTTTTTTEITELPKKTTLQKQSTEATPITNTTRSVNKSFWDAKNKTQTTSSTTTTTTTTTTTRPTTTRIVITTKQASTTPYITTFSPRETSTTPKPEIKQPSTHIPRNINRFRQSTLFYKGTSVKHDKWSFKSNNSSQPHNYRRTSNFQGYITSTSPATSTKDQHLTHTSDRNTMTTTEKISSTKSAEKLISNSVLSTENSEDNKTENSQEALEYIFDSTSTANTNNEVIGLNRSKNESVPAQFESSKNKTKCKKKMTTTTIETPTESYPKESTPKTTMEDSTDDIFEQLFGFNFNTETSTAKETSKLELLEGESTHHASFLKADDELTDFMADFNKKHKHTDPITEDDYDDEDEDDDDEDENDDEDDVQASDDESIEDDNEDATSDNEGDKKESSRDSRYESYDLGRPYSFLELMAME